MCVCACVRFSPLYLLTEWMDHITLVTFSKVKVTVTERDGHKNLVNLIAPEPLKGFEPKLRYFPQAGDEMKFEGYALKAQGHRKHFIKKAHFWQRQTE